MDAAIDGMRPVYFANDGWLSAAVRRFESMTPGETLIGPAIIESPFTSVVLNPGAVAERRPSGSLSIRPGAAPLERTART
jgi:N-methylhydantoinase A